MTQNTSCTLILAVLGVTIVAVILSLSFMLSPNCCGAPGVTETVASIYATNTAVQGWINETATAHAWTLTPSPTPH